MNFTISRRLAALVSIAALVTLVLTAVQLLALKDGLYQERRAAVTAHVEAAVSIVKATAAEAEAGRITTAEAQLRARAAVRAIRYGKGDYFFVYQEDGLNVVHGLLPESEGKNLIGTKDPNGVPLVVELIAAAKRGGAFVSYAYPRTGQNQPSPKLAYALPYAPWGWVIGSAVYVDDLDATFWAHVRDASLWSTALIALLIGSGWYLARGLVVPIGALTQTMR